MAMCYWPSRRSASDVDRLSRTRNQSRNLPRHRLWYNASTTDNGRSRRPASLLIPSRPFGSRHFNVAMGWS